ncbi:hypothetical protein BBP40_004735 [Aspergillus hancockii]|nr:hypothetical protein BBP40_004735 [Aspergillus hancockii]
MPIDNYGVWKAKLVLVEDNSDGHGTQLPHLSLFFRDNEPTDKWAAITTMPVNQSASGLVFWLVEDFENWTELRELTFGFHRLAGADQRTRSLALDYIRANPFQRETGRFQGEDSTSKANDLATKILPILHNAVKKNAAVYFYGAKMKSGYGICDMHMNQGGRGQWSKENGVWQDGGLLIDFGNHWTGVFMGFASQAVHTDDSTGHPIPSSGYLTWNDFFNPDVSQGKRTETDLYDTPVVISQAFVRPPGPGSHPGCPRASVTLTSRRAHALDLDGWKVQNKDGCTASLAPDIKLLAGGSQIYELDNCSLSNQGGTVTLLDARGFKVHGVRYTGRTPQQESHVISFGTKDQAGGLPRHIPPYTQRINSFLPATAVAEQFAAEVSRISERLRPLILQGINLLDTMDLRLLSSAEPASELSELRGILVSIAKADDMAPELEQTCPTMIWLLQQLKQSITNELHYRIENRMQEMTLHGSSEILDWLATIYDTISNIWSLRCFVDLNKLTDFTNDQIESLLTVTGSAQNAFANTAASYIRWHWGKRGMDIFHWLIQLLVCLSEPGPHKLKIVDPLRIHWGDADTSSVELRGQLDDTPSAVAPECNSTIRVQLIDGSIQHYYVLVADIVEELAWVVATFRDPGNEGLSFSTARVENAFTTDNLPWNDDDHSLSYKIVHEDTGQSNTNEDDDSTCWYYPFTGLNIALGFPIPDRPGQTRGVELPFSLMTLLTDCRYPVAYEGGFVFKGWQNALFPVRSDSGLCLSEAASSLQWHLVKAEGPDRLHMAAVSDIHPIRTELSPTGFCMAMEQTKRHFLGLYPESKIFIGINDSRCDSVQPIRRDSGLKIKTLRTPIEWTRAVNLAVSGGLFASAGISTGIRFLPKKERQMTHSVERTRAHIINDTINNSTILFDVGNRRAWMLPQIYVVIYLVQAWARKALGNASASIRYLPSGAMNEENLRNELQAFLSQPTGVSFNMMETFVYYARILDRLQDEEALKPAKKGKRLAGVDFAGLVDERTYSVIRTDIDLRFAGSWLEVLKSNWVNITKPYKIVTLFCHNIPRQPILPTTPVCDTWFPPPVERDYLIVAMQCLERLAIKYGTDPFMLSCDHSWVCGALNPFATCGHRNCNLLQSIAIGLNRDGDIFNLVLKAHPYGAVVFGNKFDEQNRRCSPTSHPDTQAQSPSS